ncbi:MAG: flagellar export chaperone FliS [Humidesulfovibrio sp.]|uniref:flagellar export chaperone FliS n=1 Tax=Humidesulfovibrio sp. TaxID=2910988 RepID=UPI0027EFD361|nr:flagellar export chaperone FliS [Humidesulfovibrio sp.]MDQ7835153.1 flagellar export chaperone FliS [Humidesulfovibrio sp.]
MLKAAKAYLSTQVTTATQGDLLLMLYDTAIKHIKQAKDKIAERDFAAKGISITKAIEIVSELHESLNKEKGGDIARNLSRMYFMCNTRLLQANIEMNPKKLDEVIAILTGLRQAFAQIIPGQEGMAPASQSSVTRPAQDAQPSAKPAVAAPAYPTAYPSAYPQPTVPTAAAPQPEASAVPEVAAVAEVAEAPAPADAPDAPEQIQDRATVNSVRFRAANAYANSR